MHGHLLDYRWQWLGFGSHVAVTRANKMGEEKKKKTPVEAAQCQRSRHAQTIIQNMQAPPNLSPYNRCAAVSERFCVWIVFICPQLPFSDAFETGWSTAH
jgi:hypothetical protein